MCYTIRAVSTFNVETYLTKSMSILLRNNTEGPNTGLLHNSESMQKKMYARVSK